MALILFICVCVCVGFHMSIELEPSSFILLLSYVLLRALFFSLAFWACSCCYCFLVALLSCHSQK